MVFQAADEAGPLATKKEKRSKSLPTLLVRLILFEEEEEEENNGSKRKDIARGSGEERKKGRGWGRQLRLTSKKKAKLVSWTLRFQLYLSYGIVFQTPKEEKSAGLDSINFMLEKKHFVYKAETAM